MARGLRMDPSVKEPADRGIVDRARGALVGVHAGDSLGATLEFQPADTCWARYPGGGAARHRRWLRLRLGTR